MTSIYVVEILDPGADEHELEILFVRNGKKYRGPLFFDFNDDLSSGSKLVKTIDEWIVDPHGTSKNQSQEDQTCFYIYLELCKKHGITTYSSTMSTLEHWSFISGFTDIIHHITKEVM